MGKAAMNPKEQHQASGGGPWRLCAVVYAALLAYANLQHFKTIWQSPLGIGYGLLICFAALPLLSLAAGVVGSVILWQVPRMVLAKEYDVIPRKESFAYLIAGTLAALFGTAMTVISYTGASPGGHYLIYFGLIVGGLVGVVQGLGILFFRSKMLGVVALIYLVLAGVLGVIALATWAPHVLTAMAK